MRPTDRPFQRLPAARSRRSVRESPSMVQGYSWRKRVTAAARYGKAAVSPWRRLSRASGVGSRNACQASSANEYCASLTGCRVSSSDANSSGVSSPRPLNLGDRETIRCRRGSPPSRREGAPDPAQKLNQIQLIEEVVLEPQDQLVVRLVAFDRGSPWLMSFTGSRRGARVTARRDSAYARRSVPRQSGRREQVLHEGIRPDRQRARNAGGFNESRRARAVCHVEEASP